MESPAKITTMPAGRIDQNLKEPDDPLFILVIFAKMKEIFSIFKGFFRNGPVAAAYIYTLLFVGVAIALNYAFDFENSILDRSSNRISGMLYYFMYYGVAYFGVAVPVIFMYDKKTLLNKTFWAVSLAAIGVAGLASGFHYYKHWFDSLTDQAGRVFCVKIVMQGRRFVLFLLTAFLLYKCCFRNDRGFFGLRSPVKNIRTYLLLLMAVLPFIVLASFSESFQEAYPRYKPWFSGAPLGMPVALHTLIFNFFYSLDFVATEFLFRGVLVVGLASVLGRNAVLPMVAVYAFIHFGKPPAEAISSVFGGFILGVIANHTRSIWSGVLLHLGIAWAMEISAYLQHYF